MKIRRFRFAIVFCLAMGLAGVVARAERYALLVGVSDYASPRIKDLGGCENDVKLMAYLLTNRYQFPQENVRMLLSRGATKAAILGGLSFLAETSKAGDDVVFFFSGHGSQVTDLDGDESDGMDEVLLPGDVSPPNVSSVLVDDELNRNRRR